VESTSEVASTSCLDVPTMAKPSQGGACPVREVPGRSKQRPYKRLRERVPIPRVAPKGRIERNRGAHPAESLP